MNKKKYISQNKLWKRESVKTTNEEIFRLRLAMGQNNNLVTNIKFNERALQRKRKSWEKAANEWEMKIVTAVAAYAMILVSFACHSAWWCIIAKEFRSDAPHQSEVRTMQTASIYMRSIFCRCQRNEVECKHECVCGFEGRNQLFSLLLRYAFTFYFYFFWAGWVRWTITFAQQTITADYMVKSVARWPDIHIRLRAYSLWVQHHYIFLYMHFGNDTRLIRNRFAKCFI